METDCSRTSTIFKSFSLYKPEAHDPWDLPVSKGGRVLMCGAYQRRPTMCILRALVELTLFRKHLQSALKRYERRVDILAVMHAGNNPARPTGEVDTAADRG